MKILVPGGTGRVGSEVVKELQKRKVDVRLLVRKNDAPMPTGVDAAIGDLLDPVSVEKAMDGVDKLYLLNAVLPDELTQGLIAYDLAKKLRHMWAFSPPKPHLFPPVIWQTEQWAEVLWSLPSTC